MDIETHAASHQVPLSTFFGFTSPDEGLIVAHLGVAVEVLFGDGDRRQVRVKRSSGHVVGDHVLVRSEVLERLPRRTELRRRDARGSVHLVGANLDVLGIVVAPQPAPPAGFIDRAIVAARAAQLRPFLVLNKSDLAGTDSLLATLAATYPSAAVPVFPLSVRKGEGFEALTRFLGEGHRGAFVGTSGVGKSSLLNALCPDISLKVGEINDHNGQGRHTTTVATLHPLPQGGALVDTPGFRDFGLVDLAPAELAAHFPGFESAQESSCRFRNCLHRSEPGCAVLAQVAEGRIEMERYETYRQIFGEIEASEEEAKRRAWKK